MDVSAGSSSSTISSSSSSDTEVRAKPTSVKKARISKSSKVTVRHKHRMKLQMTKQKHHHKKSHKRHQCHSMSDCEHRHKMSNSCVQNRHKRMHRHSHSSSSSEASSRSSEVSSETGSDSDSSTGESSVSSNDSSSEQECSYRTLRKHSKPSAKRKRKKDKHLHKTSKGRKLRAVFRENFAALMLLVSGPEQLAAQLYSKSLISPATLDKVFTLPTSQQQKVLHLLLDLDRKIRADPEKLFVLIQVIQGDPSLEELAAKMLYVADGVTDANADQPKRSDPKSASPNCTTNAETGKRSAVEESDSSHQQSYSTQDATAPPITHQPPPVSSAIARYQCYLKSLYMAKPTPVDDKLFIGPSAQYINLAIIKKELRSEEEVDEFTRATLHGGVDEILFQKEQVHLEDIFVFKSKSPLKCIFVEGPPGIGKSTFAWELCRKWDELETMRQFSLVVLLKLREKHIQNCKSLSDLLNHPTDPILGRAVVDEILEGEGVLLILDGLDEFPSTLLEEDNCLVRQLITGSCLPKATIVVTSRPTAKISFNLCRPQVSKHIEIVGFTEEDRVKYTETVFSSQPDMLVHFLKYSFSNPAIKTMMYIPLVCAIVAQIYKEYGGARKLIPRTMTQLYTALCRSLLRRYLVENGLLSSYDTMPNNFEDFPQDVFTKLCTLSEIAYDAILKEKLVFYKHELPEGFEHMGFMNECRELYVDRGMDTSYNFIHLSLQEYLAAWHISQLPSTPQALYFKRQLCIPSPLTLFMKRQKNLTLVTFFLAGITGLRNGFWQSLRLVPFRAKEVEVTPDVCRCLFEAQNSKFCQEQLCSVTTNVQQHSQVFTFLSDHEYTSSISGVDFYALGYCVAHSRGLWAVRGNSHNAGGLCAIGAEALEMLVDGMKHESKHHLPTGSITELKFCNMNLSIGIAWLKELPRPVLTKLSVLTLRHCGLCPKSFEFLVPAIFMMPNLHCLDVSSNSRRPGEAVPRTLIESLSSLKKLECLRINGTNIGSHDALKALANLIRTSNSLQSLHVENSLRFEISHGPCQVLKEVIPSALATRNLKELGLSNITMSDMIQLSLLLPTNSSITCLTLNGEHHRYNDGLAYLSQALYTNTSLTSITQCGLYFSRSSSGYSRFSREETITLLNYALQQNVNLRNLKLERSLPYDLCLPRQYSLQRLAHQLRRGPMGPQLKLKRAQSLPCLSRHIHSPTDFPHWLPNAKLSLPWFSVYSQSSLQSPRKLRNAQRPRYRSAPDLSLIESISSLHPSLIECLEIQKFYYTNISL